MNCSLCHGPTELLGALGRLKQYRCRNCGMIFSRQPRATAGWGIATQASVRTAKRKLAAEKRVADRIDGYDRDDLGASPDY